MYGTNFHHRAVMDDYPSSCNGSCNAVIHHRGQVKLVWAHHRIRFPSGRVEGIAQVHAAGLARDGTAWAVIMRLLDLLS